MTNPSNPSLFPSHPTVSLGSGALTPSPLATQYPHLSHYIASLLQIALQENLQAQTVPGGKENTEQGAGGGGGGGGGKKHPLSVSSASSDVHEDDDNDNDNEENENNGSDKDKEKEGPGHARSTTSSSSPPSIGLPVSEEEGEPKLRLEIPRTGTQVHVPSTQREELIRKVVDLLGNEKEEEVKGVVKERLGVLGNVSTGRDFACSVRNPC